MHLDQINQQTIPIIQSFPVRLFFDGETPWMEAISVDYSEVSEFQKVVNDIAPKSIGLMCTAGYLHTYEGEEIDCYAVYQYEKSVLFVTIVYIDGTYSYDLTNSNSKWVKWAD